MIAADAVAALLAVSVVVSVAALPAEALAVIVADAVAVPPADALVAGLMLPAC